ncbi:MAG TPA: GNAT family N-acetyltransferase [Gemmatimonadaceae bacterium]|nr:GNAT family N-acetyltransferase [Gemmatimonadaceae bacterium]
MRAWQWRAFAELTPHELYSILQLRALVFVVEQTCAYNDLDGYDVASDHLFTQDADGGVIAYLRLLPPGVKYAEPSLGRVVTHPDARRAGLGVELMREGLRRVAVDFPGTAVRIGAQRRLEQFYRSLGFVTVSAPYDEDGIEHVEMLRN